MKKRYTFKQKEVCPSTASSTSMERADGERLIPEYEGESPADYPGNNDEYSVSGYHYDKRGE